MQAAADEDKAGRGEGRRKDGEEEEEDDDEEVGGGSGRAVEERQWGKKEAKHLKLAGLSEFANMRRWRAPMASTG